MEYYVKSVVPIIEKNYDKFTTVEKSIADFFIHNQEKVDLSSKAMADRLYVSEASLSRFAQKCGYRGYREFVYQYEVTFVEKQESMTGNTRMILNSYQELLNKDWFMTFPDFQEYIAAKERAYEDYRDRMTWAKKMLVNIAKAGFFSSDRTIAQYNKDIWGLEEEK